MWTARWASAALVGAACTAPVEPLPLPPGARLFIPEGVFRQWWAQVERCAGLKRSYDAVRWYVVPGETPFRVPRHDSPVLGYWDPGDNRIVLLEYLPERRAPYVRHEAMHAILRRTDHPPSYFVNRCGTTIGGPESPDLPGTVP